MATTMTVYAAPGRLYPHPAGHTSTGARFIGRGFDRNAPADCDVDTRWPIKDEGEQVPQDSDMHRALQQGDLLAAIAPRAVAPAEVLASPEPQPVAPKVIITDAPMVGESILRTAPAATHE